MTSGADGEADYGPNYHGELLVAGMAPEFLRYMVEFLRGVVRELGAASVIPPTEEESSS